MTDYVRFRGGNRDWVSWAQNNQDPKGGEYPLIPCNDLIESTILDGTFVGLKKVYAHNISTEIPRLPWGSQKALIVNLVSGKDPLKEVNSEVSEVEAILKITGFDVKKITSSEKDEPKIIRELLASNHWDIIHFCGHMTLKDNHFIGQSGGLSAEDFVASCCRAAPPRLVILNACRSGDTSVGTDVAGISGPIAEQFCIRGVDAVVASRWDIWDKAAMKFGIFFWEYLRDSLESFTTNDTIQLDVEEAVLHARQNLKKTFPGKDACWLAYTLFNSRNECIIPSQNIVVPGITPGESHPPFINMKQHTRLCEHLAPGGAGLYLINAPECSGKTTSAILALQTLGISEELVQFTFSSLRHDDSLSIINSLQDGFNSLDKAPLLPFVLDDAELLTNHVGTDIHKSILKLSKRAPILLIMRQRIENENLYTMPFEKEGLDPDELIHLHPNIPTVNGLINYLSIFGIDLQEKNAEKLLLRMRGRFFGMPSFYKSFLQGKLDVDLLECPAESGLINRISTISDDENLAIQMVSSLITPIACKIRCHIAWELLKKDGHVTSNINIFQTLRNLDILQDWQSDEFIPQPEDINEEYLENIPEIIRDVNIRPEDKQFLEEIEGNNPLLQYPWVTELFTGYTINNNHIEILRQIPEHMSLNLGHRAALSSIKWIDPEGKMPRIPDGYDEDEMKLRVSQPQANEKIELDSSRLLGELVLGSNSKINTLDENLKKWFDNPRALLNAIKEKKEAICVEISRRLPSLSIYTIRNFGEFVIKNNKHFATDEFACANLLFMLQLNGKSKTEDTFWLSDKWIELAKESRETLVNSDPEQQNILHMKEMEKLTDKLLFFTNHNKRHKPLLEASAKVMQIQSDYRYELMLLHYSYAQTLLRHLLFKGKSEPLKSFRKHVERLQELLLVEPNPSFDDSKYIPNLIKHIQFFRMMLALFENRIELRKNNDAVLELQWIRYLLLAGEQMGQLSSELRKGLITEAASRFISLTRRGNLIWSKDIQSVRASLFRELRKHAWKAPPKWITEELAIHLMASYDPLNPCPPSFGHLMSREEIDSMTHVKWNKLFNMYIEQHERKPADKVLDLYHWLKIKSASNEVLDRELGGLDASGSCHVAALIWRKVKDLGENARPFGQFAATFHDYLNRDEKIEAERFRPQSSSWRNKS